MALGYDETKFKKGDLLAQGKGVDDMMRQSYIHHYNDKNTILEVKNPSSLESSWKIYDKLNK